MRSNHPNDVIRDRARSAVHLAQIPGDRTMFDGRVVLRHDNLDLPLRTKKPTVFAVWNDLHHEDVLDEFRDRAYAVMSSTPWHTYLILTKRAERMADYFSSDRWMRPDGKECFYYQPVELPLPAPVVPYCFCFSGPWPIKNVWHDVTCEDQQRADERIPHLLRVPGNRFLSLEPLLGPVNLSEKQRDGERYSWLRQTFFDPSSPCNTRHDQPRIHAVLLGGESGPNARPMHPAWAKFVRDQCEAACVPFFFKQWGEWLPVGLLRANGRDLYLDLDGSTVAVNDYVEGKGKDPVRMVRVGKKTAGRLLQGCMHDSLPWGGVK